MHGGGGAHNDHEMFGAIFFWLKIVIERVLAVLI